MSCSHSIRVLGIPVLCLMPLLSARADEAAETTKEAVIPVFTLQGALTETPSGDNPFLALGGSESLRDLVVRLEKAADDDEVSAIVLLLGELAAGSGQTEELRAALSKIKAAGKKIHAHVDSMSMGDYLLLSGADQISAVPTGDIWITGIAAESPYLRGLLDKVGVEPDFFTCGDFKSAGEMFMRRGPSSQAEANLNWLLDGIFESYVSLIAEGRGAKPDAVRAWIDRGLYSAQQAKDAGIIDAVQYRQEFVESLRETYGEKIRFEKRYGKNAQRQIDLSSPFGVMKFYMDLLSGTSKPASKKDSIAIVYVEGPIMPGSGSPGGFPFGSGGIAFSSPIRKALEEAAEDEHVKGVVLRINSPGGSAVASEIILHATKRVKQKKPLVVSMGDMAGSGGYYVACGADTIFADESTLTGSIGVVVGKLATSAMWQKVGVDWESTRRGANAGILSSSDVFSDHEREILQSWMNEIYEVFKGHVTNIRGDRLAKDIEELAGGRVYTGRQALDLGLVDQLGGLNSALEHVAKEAGLEKYEVRVLPRPKDFLELLMQDLTGSDQDGHSIETPGWTAGNRAAPVLLEAALPLLEHLDPQRVRAMRQALQQLTILEHDQALLTMPIIQIRQ